jgi:hypothetical protein
VVANRYINTNKVKKTKDSYINTTIMKRTWGDSMGETGEV